MEEQSAETWTGMRWRGLFPISARTRAIILLTFSFVGAFALVIGLKLSVDRRNTLALAEQQAASSVGVLALQFRTLLVSVESLMDYGALAYGANGEELKPQNSQVAQILIDRLSQVPAIQQLAVINAQGQTLFDPEGLEFQSPDITAQRYFQYHKENTSMDLFVTSGADFTLSKRLETATGQFAGVIIVVLARHYLDQLNQSADLTGHASLILAGRNGAVLGASKVPKGPGPQVSRLLGLTWPIVRSPNGKFVATTRPSPDAGQVLLAGSALNGTPFTLILVQPVSYLLQTWYASLRFYGLVILALGLFGAGICGILIRQMQRRTESDRARQSSEERLNLAVTAAKCGIWDWDLEKNVIHWSPSMYALLGRTQGRAQMSPTDVLELIHPSDRGILAEIAVEAECNPEGYDTSFRLHHAQHHWIWVHAKGRMIRSEARDKDTDGQKRLTGILVDISAQKKAEALIISAETRVRDAIESTSESFALWDAEDKLVMHNKRFAQFYQVDPQKLQPGIPREDVMTRAAVPVKVFMHEDTPNGGTTEIQFAGERWIHLNTRRTHEGGTVSVGTDITPLKEQEEELLHDERRLKALVGELEGSQKELRNEASDRAELAVKYAAEKARAEEANRSKTEFLANMSHELRTPLNAIMGFAQVMQQGLFGPLNDKRYEEYTQHILESGQYLLDLISDILDMSKIEVGKITLEKQDVSLEQVLLDCIRIIEPRAFEEGLRLENKLPLLPVISADKRATKQVFLNLLSNAVKFTPRGGTITLNGELADDHIVISIADTGIGIAEKDLRRIARPFEQIEPQKSIKRSGSGLGLALAKSLVEMHEGTLTVKSSLGAGTTVRVTLPRKKPLTENIGEAFQEQRTDSAGLENGPKDQLASALRV